MGDLDHWDEQRRRMRDRVEPLVGFVGVGGRLKVVDDEHGLTIQPAARTVVWLLLAAVVMVPYAIWAFFQTFDSTLGLVGVVVVGGMLEFLLIRYLVRMQRLRIVGQDMVIEGVFGGKVTAKFQAEDVASMYVGSTWYRSEGIETRNNVIWLSQVAGGDIPLVASDKDVDEVVAVISNRLGLPVRLSNYRSDSESS